MASWRRRGRAISSPPGPGSRQKATLCDVLAPAKIPRFEEQPLSLGESLAAGVVPILCWWWRRPWRVVFGLWAFVGGRQRTQECPHSNTERGRPDWRMIDIKVPERSSA